MTEDVDFRICSMVKTENPEVNRKLSKSKKQPVLTVYRYQKTAKKQSSSYLSTILALITKRVTFEQQQKMLRGNFEQRFESCVLNAKNDQKSTRNQLNILNTSKNELMVIFRGFRVFEYALW